MGYDDYDEEFDGQMSLDDLYPAPKGMFAVSKIFVRARKQMTPIEYKAFVYALSKIDWTKSLPASIEMDKRELAQILNIQSDENHLSQNLFRALKDISVHSFTEFKDQDKGLYISGTIINTLVLNQRKKAILDINPRYAKLFSELNSDYLTMWSFDIFNMRTERSITFYEQLRAHSDTTKQCEKGLGVKALKELFDIPKEGPGSYIRKQGGFDRANFEKYIIDPICEDLSKCEMIQLIVQPDGKYYEKVKEGRKVKGYRFYWTVSDRPKIANAGEIKEIRENIAKDPKTLKIAKDLAKGKKKSRKEQSSFMSYQQNNIDFDELEQKLLDN